MMAFNASTKSLCLVAILLSNILTIFKFVLVSEQVFPAITLASAVP